MLLTSCDRAKDVVERGLLVLDQKLAIFTVVGTQEQHLVKLFSRLSCSCPATATCYHIMLAKMAVGCWPFPYECQVLTWCSYGNGQPYATASQQTETGRQDLWQEAATSARCRYWHGSRRQRCSDDVAGLLIAAVTVSSQSSKTASPQSGECDTQLCWKRSAAGHFLGGCELCPRWYHRVCLGIGPRAVINAYRCDLCCWLSAEWRSVSLDTVYLGFQRLWFWIKINVFFCWFTFFCKAQSRKLNTMQQQKRTKQHNFCWIFSVLSYSTE